MWHGETTFILLTRNDTQALTCHIQFHVGLPVPIGIGNLTDVFPFVRDSDVPKLQGEVSPPHLGYEKCSSTLVAFPLPLHLSSSIEGTNFYSLQSSNKHPLDSEADRDARGRDVARQDGIFSNSLDNNIVRGMDCKLT